MLRKEKELLSKENSFLKQEVGSFILKLLRDRRLLVCFYLFSSLLPDYQVPKYCKYLSIFIMI